MPLFLFHLRTPEGLDSGDDGLDLPDIETAYLKACEAIPDMAAEFLYKGSDPFAYSFVIADAGGAHLMEVPFDERLRVRRPRFGQDAQTGRLSQEIAEAVAAARATVQRSREILARARAIS